MGPAESKVRDKTIPFPRREWREASDKGAPETPLNTSQIQLNTWPRRIIAIALVMVSCGVLIYRTSSVFLAAWITRTKNLDPSIYERAIKYDPNNADYHFVLAQIYNHSTEHLNIRRAGEEYEAAVRLNPYRSAHWLELSKYYEQQKNIERGRYAMKMALERDPNYAQIHWAAANLYLRLNDLSSADFELRRTADQDGAYLPQVLDLVWRFYEDPDRIMSTHVPNTRSANLIALNFLVSQKSDRGAELAWSKLKTFETTRQERMAYVDYLVSLGRSNEAWKVFMFPSEAPSAFIFNRSFESEPMNGAFDWHFASTEHAQGRRDTTTAKTGLASWLVIFDGTENIDYSGLRHLIPVVKGRQYNLSFWMRTEGISTNEGVFVEVDGQTSEKQIGSTLWRQFFIPFTANSDLATVYLRRVPSQKLDNLLKGKVWVDDFAVN
jgi:tetratricopeptide (TPR) repeat protein